MSVFKEINHIHCIGIGGIGLSALARFFLSEGKIVSGSDLHDSRIIQELIKEGAAVQIGHGVLPENVQAVVYSEAISKDNPERLEASGLLCMNYFDALGEISKAYTVLAVAGSHGKTTSTAMLGFLLQEYGLDPTVLLGSTVPQFGNKNFRKGQSKYLVLEACEYRRNFLSLHPDILGITNIEFEHPDYFKDEADYKRAFKELEAQSGRVVKLMEYKGILKIPGEHNMQNAALAASMAHAIGIEDFSPLERFEGTERRFQYRGNWKGAHVIDDYAHHPTEIQVTIETARHEHPKKRIIAVFQAHQHSRTRVFLDEFIKALSLADMVIIPNIYATRDSAEDKSAISSEDFANALSSASIEVAYTASLSDTTVFLDQNLSEKDLLLVMGAGDVNKILPKPMTVHAKMG